LSFISIIVILLQLVKFIPKPRKRGPKVNLDNKKKHLPELIGGLMGFSVMSQNLICAIPCGILGAGLGLGSRKLYNWFFHKLTEEKKSGEILMLFEVISVYSLAGYSLYEAISASLYFANLTKKPLQKCLRQWGQGPERALKKMAEDIGSIEAETLSKILQRAITVGPNRLADFLSQESATLEKIRQYRIEKGIGARPLIQTLYLLFPGLALVGVTLLPIGYHISQTIMSVNLS